MRANISTPVRYALLYGGALAALAFAAEWTDLSAEAGTLPLRWYGVAIALAFAALGIWLGMRLVPRPRAGAFARNAAAIRALGISARELEVLERLAQGASNKAIARQLSISPNTVKTHLARLFDKLGATNRTQAIAKARALEIVP